MMPPKGSRKIDEQEVIRLVDDGTTTDQIAVRLGVSDTTIRTIRRAHGRSARTGRQATKDWREFTCAWCGAVNRTKRDDKQFCGRACCSRALMAARWNYPGRPVCTPEILRSLYWGEGRTSIEIAARLRMSHKGVLGAMRRWHIPRRGLGPRTLPHCAEEGCRLPIYKIQHKTNGSSYGRRCRLHWIVFRMEVNQRYNDKHLGKDDEAWLRRLRQLLARVKTLNREVSQSLNPASRPATTSPAACPP